MTLVNLLLAVLPLTLHSPTGDKKAFVRLDPGVEALDIANKVRSYPLFNCADAPRTPPLRYLCATSHLSSCGLLLILPFRSASSNHLAFVCLTPKP